MEESAPKRRRTSPRTSTGIARDATPDAPTPSRSRKRPSFASPTKSSLARHNPQILERRLSASPSKPAETRAGPSHSPIAEGDDESLVDVLTAQQEPTQNIAGSEAGGEENPETRRDDAVPSSGRAVRRARGSLSAAPRRSPAKPSPRPLPPPGPEGEDELNPFLGRVLRRSLNTGVSIPPAPEPELPQPVHDPVSSTPPRGIHSSPSRWRDKNKPKKSSPLISSPLRSSPLKNSPLKPSPLKQAPVGPTGPAGTRTGSPPPHKGNKKRQLQADNPVLRDLALDPTSSDIRRVPAFDQNTAKKRERDALRAELATLEKDMTIAERENQRIRTLQDSGRVVAPPNGDELLGLMWRHLVPLDGNALPPQSQQLVKSVLNPMGLLPFSKPTYDASFAASSAEKLSGVNSHHPIPMTAEDERPYLQLFTPFDVTTDIAVLPTQPTQSLRQRHSITVRSRTAPGLFSAKVNLVVDAANLAILELGVPALEPAAKPELGPFVEKICAGDCNRSMQRNIGIVSWAMAEWLRVAVQRARFWVQLDRELASKEDLVTTTKKLRLGKSRRKTRDADADEQDEPEDDAQASCKMTDLLHFMGRQAHEVTIPAVSGQASPSLRLEWRIDFDWTGEAQSKVAAMVGVPGKCKLLRLPPYGIFTNKLQGTV